MSRPRVSSIRATPPSKRDPPVTPPARQFISIATQIWVAPSSKPGCPGQCSAGPRRSRKQPTTAGCHGLLRKLLIKADRKPSFFIILKLPRNTRLMSVRHELLRANSHPPTKPNYLLHPGPNPRAIFQIAAPGSQAFREFRAKRRTLHARRLAKIYSASNGSVRQMSYKNCRFVRSTRSTGLRRCCMKPGMIDI